VTVVVVSSEVLDVLVTTIGMVAAAWWVACWASITLSPTTPATLTVAIAALAVAIRRMPSARVVIATSYMQCHGRLLGWASFLSPPRTASNSVSNTSVGFANPFNLTLTQLPDR
jgi:hypothetical protein